MNLVTIEEVEQYTCDAYRTTISQVRDMSRKGEPAKARKMMMYLLFAFTKMDSKEIAHHYNVGEFVSVRAFSVVNTMKKYDHQTKEIVQDFRSIYESSPKIIAC